MAGEVLKVMVLDDDVAIRQSFGDYFEDQGLQPLLVESAEIGLGLLNEITPDVVIVDIRLGGMAGDDFIRRVYDLLPNGVFIVCTGSPVYGIPENLLPLDRVSTNVFQKPVTDLGLLRQEIIRMVGRRRVDAGKDGDA